MQSKTFTRRLTSYYLWYVAGFLLLLVVLAILEKEGIPRLWIGYLFLFSTIVLYASIGFVSRTSDVSEYYVAGRQVPPVFNGMATAADWMSAATFISLAGGLYLQGFDGLAYLMGWTGGFCMVAFLIAPYLRRFGQYTVADLLAARYPVQQSRSIVRMLAALATIIISFTYVVAQIYGVGLITSRFTGIDFSVGIFLGLASILVCSFLGGMRAITWTQVAQYAIILAAYLIPVGWLAAKHADLPIPQLATFQVMGKLEAREQALRSDVREKQVHATFLLQAQGYEEMIRRLPDSFVEGRESARQRVQDLKNNNATLQEIRTATRDLAAYPKSEDEARRVWNEARKVAALRSAPLPSQSEPFPGDPETSNAKRNNFLALVLSLMMGTAALPHLLVRFYTTPTVADARRSAFWTLFFILLVYTAIPAVAVLVKYDMLTQLVGMDFNRLPSWIGYWANVDRLNPLVSVADVNGDGIVQMAEIVLAGDVLVLATPEIAGLPYVISGLVAAGGLAAALSTADGLLLTIASALSHDTYYKTVDPTASTQKRVTVSKLLLLVVAMVAAYAASLKPADILSVVGAAFSLAASTLFPVLVCTTFWKRANGPGAVAAMLTGLLSCVAYVIAASPALGGSESNQLFGIAAQSAAVFAVPIGFLTLVVVSLATRPPPPEAQALVDYLRQA